MPRFRNLSDDEASALLPSVTRRRTGPRQCHGASSSNYTLSSILTIHRANYRSRRLELDFKPDEVHAPTPRTRSRGAVHYTIVIA